ncbi:hypothetical protein BJ165DRAFT_386193 [Panaeolus papilionaceus]|nr:hypothetical protein BJ165DRAFT_386193 [Panaeolus papilionaceus]
MSTRTRAAKAGTTSKRSSATPSTTGAKSRGAKAVLVKEEPMDTDSDVKPKEAGRARGRKSEKGATARVPKKSASIGEETKAKAKPGPKMKDVYCTCSAGDDGSPMIFCSGCRIWFHFTCADLSEADAEEISVYICPTCSQTTGRRSACEFLIHSTSYRFQLFSLDCSLILAAISIFHYYNHYVEISSLSLVVQQVNMRCCNHTRCPVLLLQRPRNRVCRLTGCPVFHIFFERLPRVAALIRQCAKIARIIAQSLQRIAMP